MDLIDHICACDDLAEDRVPSIEMRGRQMRDEPLRSFGILTVACHTYDASLRVADRCDLSANGIPRSAVASLRPVACLNDEIRYNTMEDVIRKVADLRELQKVERSQRCFILV